MLDGPRRHHIVEFDHYFKCKKKKKATWILGSTSSSSYSASSSDLCSFSRWSMSEVKDRCHKRTKRQTLPGSAWPQVPPPQSLTKRLLREPYIRSESRIFNRGCLAKGTYSVWSVAALPAPSPLQTASRRRTDRGSTTSHSQRPLLRSRGSMGCPFKTSPFLGFLWF